MFLVLFKIFSFVSSWKFIIMGGFLIGSFSIWNWKRKIYKRGYDAGFSYCIRKIEKASKDEVKKRKAAYESQKNKDEKTLKNGLDDQDSLIKILD